MDFSQVWVCENENHPSYTVVEINWSPSDEAQHHPMLSAGSSDHQSHRQQQHWSGTRTPSELSLLVSGGLRTAASRLGYTALLAESEEELKAS